MLIATLIVALIATLIANIIVICKILNSCKRSPMNMACAIIIDTKLVIISILFEL